MPVTRELVRSVRERLKQTPATSIAQLAEELHASEAEVVTALPVKMRLRARNSAAEAIWDKVAQWNSAVVDWRKGAGGSGRAPFSGWAEKNFGDLPADGRKHSRLAAIAVLEGEIGSIWFVSRPLETEESLSIRFFDKQGEHLLSVFIGKDSHGGIDQRDRAEYDSLRKQFGVIPVPRMRCRGCGSCTCGNPAHP